jgi:exopolyphosphatase/guanosine-5'-triphosphate,3'-diphosphate pyrophosphatase
MRVAVIDLGSTSFRLVVAKAGASGDIRHVVRKREHLNLGMVVGREGMVPEADARAAVKAAVRLLRRARRDGAHRVITVATSALRDAANRDDLAKRLERALGEPVRFLSGAEEAALAYAALDASLDLGPGAVLGADLGGGSLELAVGAGRALAWTESLPLGSSRLTGRFIESDPPTAEERRRLAAHIEARLADVAPKVLSLSPQRCVAAGGTVKALARLIAAERSDPPEAIGGMTLSAGELTAMADRLLSATRADRLAVPAMSARRVEIVHAGALVLSTLAGALGTKEITASEWGLHEGIILEAMGLAGTPLAAPVAVA